MRYKLEELFDLYMGKTPSRNNSKYWCVSGNKWISIADLSQSGMYINKTKECISNEAVQESGIRIIPKNTVVMSFKLSIGKVAITAEDMFSNEAIMAFHDKGVTEILPEYLYFLLLQKDWADGANKAVKGMTLNKAALLKTEIEVCDIETQKRVVNIMNKMSTILYKSKTMLGMIDELVKSRFVEMFGDTECNKKGYPIHQLSELCTVSSSKRIYHSELLNFGVPFLRISNLVELIDTKRFASDLFISEEKYDELFVNRLVPNKGDILVTSRGTLGRCYIVQKDDRFYFQDGMISWLYDFKGKVNPLYLAILFDTRDIKQQIDNLQAGSTVAYLSIAMLKKINIVVPPLELQNEFSVFATQADKLKVAVQKALEETQNLFDSLMQEYFG